MLAFLTPCAARLLVYQRGLFATRRRQVKKRKLRGDVTVMSNRLVAGTDAGDLKDSGSQCAVDRFVASLSTQILIRRCRNVTSYLMWMRGGGWRAAGCGHRY